MADLRFNLRMALDPVAFARAMGFDPDPWQAQMLWSTSLQLAVCCSRQSGKSSTAAVKALHRALFWPGSLVLLVSPSQRQSAELFRKVADLVRLLPNEPKLEEDNKLSLQLENGSRVISLPSNPDTVRGFSAVSLLIEDEAAFVRDDFNTAIRPMLATSKGRLVLMSTPKGKRGHFFEAWQNGGPAWERLSIKASECPRIPAAFLESERAAMGDWLFRQEYLNEFTEAAGSFFSYEEVMGSISDQVQPLFGAMAKPSTTASPISSEVEPLFGASR